MSPENTQDGKMASGPSSKQRNKDGCIMSFQCVNDMCFGLF